MRMTKINFLAFTLLFIWQSVSLHAQYENVWIFPQNAGMDFNSSTPALVQSKVAGQGEAAASVCDKNGHLLFYTEGDTLWDKNGNIMPNGTGLTGVGPILNAQYGLFDYSASSSTTQGALIVPIPHSDNKYVVFSLTSFESDVAGKLTYSIVNMDLNGGLGDVEQNQKAISLGTDFSERMSGIPGDNGNIWVLVNPTFPSSGAVAFHAFEVTADGLNTTPVISAVTGVPAQTTAGRASGELSFSPNRKKLALTRQYEDRVELYDFNAATGRVSNQVILGTGFFAATYSLCFSPNSTKLYTSAVYDNNVRKGIFQYDITGNNAATIEGTKIILDSLNNNMDAVVDLRMAMDGKIYYHYTTDDFTNSWVSRINFPDSAGEKVQIDNNIFTISTAPWAGFNFVCLPNVVPAQVFSSASFTTCLYDSTLLTPKLNNGWDHVWNDNSTNKERKINTAGIYWVRYNTLPYIMHTDTFIVTEKTITPQINVNGFELSTTIAYQTYQWYLDGDIIPGATDATCTVTRNGKYHVTVTDQLGCPGTSAIYEITNVGIQSNHLLAQSINVFPNPATEMIYIQAAEKVNVIITTIDGRKMKTIDNATNIPLGSLADGVYLFYLYNTDNQPLGVEKIVITHK